MQGNKELIEKLNALMADEIMAAEQYFMHAHMYQNWGLNKLYERVHHEMQDELGHAAALAERILFLEGQPTLRRRESIELGRDVPGMLRKDLDLELMVVRNLREVMAYCESINDYVSKDVLAAMLKDTEEDHAHWLEIQLGLIERLGLENYQQSAM